MGIGEVGWGSVHRLRRRGLESNACWKVTGCGVHLREGAGDAGWIF